MNNAIETDFFDQDPMLLAISLLGKVLRRKICRQNTTHWLAAKIVETEEYYLSDKASHSYLGYTEKRNAMFMPPRTIYMY
ncbi:MAG: DNA-3-methyladenine glycosylase [Candidatus Azotimanducaceae bacterium]|jgi:DNA-3-methyladenine glycosylase